MQGLSEEEIQAKLDKLAGKSGDYTPDAPEGALPGLVGEIGIFAVALLIFFAALAVSLS